MSVKSIEANQKFIMPDVESQSFKALKSSSTIIKQDLLDVLAVALHDQMDHDDILLPGVLKAVRSLPLDILASQGIQALVEYYRQCIKAACEALETTPSRGRFRVKYVRMDELRLATRQPGRPRKEGCCKQALCNGVRMVFDDGGSDEWGHPSVKVLLLLAKAAMEVSPDADHLRTESFLQKAVAASNDCYSARACAKSIVRDIANTVESAILAVRLDIDGARRQLRDRKDRQDCSERRDSVLSKDSMTNFSVASGASADELECINNSAVSSIRSGYSYIDSKSVTASALEYTVPKPLNILNIPIENEFSPFPVYEKMGSSGDDYTQSTTSSPIFLNVDPLPLLNDSKHAPSPKYFGFDNRASWARSVECTNERSIASDLNLRQHPARGSAEHAVNAQSSGGLEMVSTSPSVTLPVQSDNVKELPSSHVSMPTPSAYARPVQSKKKAIMQILVVCVSIILSGIMWKILYYRWLAN